MEVVKQSFNIVKEFLKSTVPPCIASVDSECQYSVYTLGSKLLHGMLVGDILIHHDSLTLRFYNKFPKETMTEIYSTLLLQKMDSHGRIRIYKMDLQLRVDIQNTIENIMRYYTEQNLM